MKPAFGYISDAIKIDWAFDSIFGPATDLIS